MRLTMNGGSFDLRSIEFEWAGAQMMAAADDFSLSSATALEPESYTIA
jgi:hypothetical protein